MDKKEIEEKTIKIIADVFGKKPEEIKRESRFIEDLHPSSMSMLALIGALSGEFGIQISSSEVQQNKTVGEAIDWLIKKLKEEGK